MLHALARRRRSAFRRALPQALVLSLLPLATAFAQSYPHVRITREGTDIGSLRLVDDLKMRAPKGVVLEVIYIEGDRYNHRDSNWYWVLLPRDPWATRPAGWVRGKDLEHVPAPQAAASHAASAAPAAVPAAPRHADTEAVAAPSASAAAPTAAAPAARAVPFLASDVVVHFDFNRSELTDAARRKLADAVAAPNANVRGVSVAVEGHADWVGGESYNERLGLARAETVRRYLAEQYQIPADRISVVSYGESAPVAPNTTREGRASNRRVVIKGGQTN